MADEQKTTEISEVQNFAGGDVKSIEPIAEVHETMHEYSGGEIVEHTNTTISPILWGFWAIVLVGIVATLLATGAIPGIHFMGRSYARPVLTNNMGYAAVAADMGRNAGGMATYAAMTSPAYIDMYRLPLPGGENLDKSVANGAQIYQTYCIGCHGPNQDGNGPNSLTLNPMPRNLRNAPFMQAMSYQRIWTSLHKGVQGTAMPRWENTLSDDQIREVISYVFSLTAPTDANGKYIRPSMGAMAGSSGSGASYGAGLPSAAPGTPSTPVGAQPGRDKPVIETTANSGSTAPPSVATSAKGKHTPTTMNGANPGANSTGTPSTPSMQ